MNSISFLVEQPIFTGCWCNNHLEKYEFVNGNDGTSKNVWNHQPDNHSLYSLYKYQCMGLKKLDIQWDTICSQHHFPQQRLINAMSFGWPATWDVNSCSVARKGATILRFFLNRSPSESLLDTYHGRLSDDNNTRVPSGKRLHNYGKSPSLS